MKKHDFESTSKKNAKEQTPEMAEREQEILMWMGDIRDDFILEAEDYKHYQSDKSVPGYFILGGTLAAAAAICTAIFFQTGRNRIDHSNVPMQLPYQTEETKEIDWETEEETTEEETTQAETTEEETTQVETTQAETTEAALQETTNESGWLSNSTNYQFMVQTDESTVSVYNAWDGSLKTIIAGKLLTGKKCVLVKNGERVPINNLQTVGYQMYVGGELQLSQEFHTYWNQLSDTVFTSSDSTLYSSGKLYNINGIELTQDNQVFRRVGDRIYSEDYVYDCDGQLLGEHPSFTAQYEFGNYVLGCDFSTNEYIMFDVDTMATVWTVSDWLYLTDANDLLSWETADGQGIVTDLMLNPKLKEADWLAQNAEWEPNGTKISIVCENKQTGEVIISLIENQEGSSIYHYYACDSH